MKQNVQAASPVAISSAGEQSQFRMSSNAKAFRVLVANLYSNKPRAILRELTANAFDSHVAAGKTDVPFDIHVPDNRDPVLRVRDYGTSMTHETIMGTYSTVFESSKDSDNSQVGSFGLGSKSPFSYRDSFTVTCWLAGRKRVYSAFIAESGIPTIQLMTDTASADQQGVEIALPIILADMYTWRNEAVSLRVGFDVMPNFTGGHDQSSADANRAVKMSGDGWKIFANSSAMSSQAYGRQGCVVYPLEINSMGSAGSGLAAPLRGLFSIPILIDFPIGELEVTPSREKLSYTPNTINNIAKRIRSIGLSIEQDLIKKIETAPTLIDAIEIGDRIASTSWDWRGIVSKAKWRGRSVMVSVDVTRWHEVETFNIQTFNYYDAVKKNFKWPNSKHFHRILYATRAPRTSRTRIFVEDITNPVVRGNARIREYMSKGITLAGSGLWIRCDPKSYKFKRFLAYSGIDKADVFLIDDLPLPVKIPRAKTKRRLNSIIDAWIWRPHALKFEPLTIDLAVTKNAYYVPIARNTPLRSFGGPPVGSHPFANLTQTLIERTAIPGDAKIIGVRENNVAKVVKAGIKNIWDTATAHIDATVDWEMLAEKRAATGLITASVGVDVFFIELAMAHATGPAHADYKLKKPHKAFTDLVAWAKTAKNDAEILASHKGIREVAMTVNRALYHPKDTLPATMKGVDTDKLIATVSTRAYPFYKIMWRNYSCADLKINHDTLIAFAHYANALDNSR